MRMVSPCTISYRAPLPSFQLTLFPLMSLADIEGMRKKALHLEKGHIHSFSPSPNPSDGALTGVSEGRSVAAHGADEL